MRSCPALAIAAAAVAVTPCPVVAQTAATARQLVLQEQRFAGQRDPDDCLRDRSSSQDIVVCGRQQRHELPLGPHDQAVHADLVSDENAQHFCGNRFRCGGNILGTINVVRGLATLLLHPDTDLGPADPIPARFRGANR